MFSAPSMYNYNITILPLTQNFIFTLDYITHKYIKLLIYIFKHTKYSMFENISFKG